MSEAIEPARPRWLVKRLPARAGSQAPGLLPSLLEDLKLNTVCRSARCPNLSECWAKRTATFMILGETCTRDCRFCAVAHGEPEPVDLDEPARVAEAARRLGLRFVVVTSVTRDDLPDGGAAQFARAVRAIHETGAKAEVLVPDFHGRFHGRVSGVHTVIDSAPEVFGHNVETVPRLYPRVRPGADYARSLRVLEEAASSGQDGLVVKSGLMLGLGETAEEVEQVMRDLLSAGVRVLTLGQYLSPDSTRLPVAEYIAPKRFDEYAARARAFGFAGVSAGPFVRSSYKAAEVWRTVTATSHHGDTETRRHGGSSHR